MSRCAHCGQLASRCPCMRLACRQRAGPVSKWASAHLNAQLGALQWHVTSCCPLSMHSSACGAPMHSGCTLALLHWLRLSSAGRCPTCSAPKLSTLDPGCPCPTRACAAGCCWPPLARSSWVRIPACCVGSACRCRATPPLPACMQAGRRCTPPHLLALRQRTPADSGGCRAGSRTTATLPGWLAPVRLQSCSQAAWRRASRPAS